MTRVLYVLSALAVVSAWALTRREREHRPIAVLLSVGLASDVLISLLQRFYLDAARARLGVSTPWTGMDRVAGHLSDAIVLSWPAALAGVALVVFLGRRPWPAVLGYVAAIGALVVLHPIGGDGSLARALRTAHIAGLAIASGCAATWYLRSEPAGDRPNTARTALLIILPIELVSLFGAWRLGFFNWHISQIGYLVMFSILVILQGGTLWLRPPSSSPPS